MTTHLMSKVLNLDPPRSFTFPSDKIDGFPWLCSNPAVALQLITNTLHKARVPDLLSAFLERYLPGKGSPFPSERADWCVQLGLGPGMY